MPKVNFRRSTGYSSDWHATPRNVYHLRGVSGTNRELVNWTVIVVLRKATCATRVRKTKDACFDLTSV